MAVTGWTIEGQALRTLGYELASVNGWDTIPSRRGGRQERAWVTGDFPTPDRLYSPRILTLEFFILPFDSVSGDQTKDPLEHLEDNVRELGALFYSDSLLTIVRTLPSGVTRTIYGEVISQVPVRQEAPAVRSMVVQVECPYPMWHGADRSQAGLSGTFNLNNAGNGYVHDAIFTFSGAATLTNNEDGRVIEVLSGASVVVDVGDRTIKQGGSDVDNQFDYTDPMWIKLNPGDNSLTLSAGTVDVAYFDGWLTA